MKACNACEDFHADNEQCPKAKEPKVEMLPGKRYGKMNLGRLMSEEMKTEESYQRSLEKEKAAYDRYLMAMSDRAVKMEQWLNAQREVEIMKKRMGMTSE